jgi:nucleotide-binding universal stress UspA family protein
MYKKIMVPLDGSKLAECVLPHLKTVIKGCGAAPEILLVRAVEPIAIPYGKGTAEIASLEQLKAFEAHNKADAEKYLKEIAAQLGKAGVKAKTKVIYGKAADALTDFAAKNNVDLVIIATHGRSGISRWVLGSVANRLIHHAPAPVLVVRAPGWGKNI